MTIVACLISVVVNINTPEKPIGMSVKTTVTGNVIASSADNYLVDFSKEAKVKGYLEDMSEVLVSKSKCVEK